MIKIIGIDLDDTLLNSNKVISQNNKEILNKISDKVYVVLVSGRPLVKKTIDYYEFLDLKNDNVYFIGYNGAAIYDVKSKEEIYKIMMDYEMIMDVHNSIDKGFNLSHYIHVKEGILYDNYNDYTYLEKKFNNFEIKEIDFGKLDNNIKCYKYMVAGEPDLIKKVFKELPKRIIEEYNVVISMPCYIEFQPKDVSKWQTLCTLGKMVGANDDEIMAIGDSLNDYDMIKKSKYGVCMENGRDDCKEVAKYVTDTNDLDGVKKAIEYFMKEIAE